ncbi:interferon-induced very large GTPase 1-like [Polypterus senegalus]
MASEDDMINKRHDFQGQVFTTKLHVFQGLLLSKNPEDLIQKRSELITFPAKYRSEHNSMQPWEITESFKSHSLQVSAGDLITNGRFRIYYEMKSCREGTAFESTKEDKPYLCGWKLRFLPMATYTFNCRDLFLHDSVISDLKKLESIKGQKEKDEQCRTILETYGSHISTSYVYGGIWLLKVETRNFSPEHKQIRKNLVQELIDLKCDVFDDIKEYTDNSIFENLLRNEYDECHLQNTTISIKTFGGPDNPVSFQQWSDGLMSNESTWKIIDQEFQSNLFPLWKILTLNHNKAFQNSIFVANEIRSYWEKKTGLEDNSAEVEGILTAKELSQSLSYKIEEWNRKPEEQFTAECADYLTECTEVYAEIQRLGNKSVDVIWCQNVTGHKSMLVFLNRLNTHVRTKHFPPMIIEVLQEQISFFFGVLKDSDLDQSPGFSRGGKNSLLPQHEHPSSEIKSVKSAKEIILKINNKSSDGNDTMKRFQKMFTYNVCIVLINLKRFTQSTGELLSSCLLTALFYPYIHRCGVLPKNGLSREDWQSLLENIHKTESYIQELKGMSRDRGQAFVFLIALKNGRIETEQSEKKELLRVLVDELGSDLSPDLHHLIITQSGEVNPDLHELTEMLDLIKCNAHTRQKSSNNEDEILKLVSSKPHKTEELQHQTNKFKRNNQVSVLLGLAESNLFSSTQIKEINSVTMQSYRPSGPQDLPWYVIQKLMMVHTDVINVRCNHEKDKDEVKDDSSGFEDDLDNLSLGQTDDSDLLHPTDVVMAVLMSSDMFVQQELILKMSMCQMAVPLLFLKPDGCCFFFLWALRTIKNKWHKKTSRSTQQICSIVECDIATYQMFTISFVRVGHLRSSKSGFLNTLLSDSQQSHTFFVYSHMECGNIPRKDSNGLVEITWYLPSGKANTDFSEPIAVLNLRGDAKSFTKQVRFLTKVSSAVFLFVDNIADEEEKLIAAFQDTKLSCVLLLNPTEDNFKAVKSRIERLKTNYGSSQLKVLLRTNKNDSEFSSKVRSAISHIQASSTLKLSIEQMSNVARDQEFEIDVDYIPCQKGKDKAEKVLKNLTDLADFKEEKLPFQGASWLEYSKLEKSQMKASGYKSAFQHAMNMKQKKKEIREEQLKHTISPNVKDFITALLESSSEERKFFLQWMKLKLDSLSVETLPKIREELKTNTKDEGEKKCLLKRLSDSSLGLEHFLREIGQMYEAYVTCNSKGHESLLNLPSAAADILLDGFPVELIDGDVSNIPLRWVSDILRQVQEKTRPDARIFVLSVLGVQSSGKSTLLNTLFGLQFAVGAGRCTRGAFMQLIHVGSDLREALGCDYIMVIDTEGLRCQEVMNLTNEQDNEMATLIVGLSDVTLVNLSSESSAEMQDILQIVVHALIRMKEIGKKPSIYFIHHNVADLSAKDMNFSGLTRLLEILDKVTEIAAKVENKEESYSKLSDVIEFNPERNTIYIPGLWHGLPPMASVSKWYSEHVFDLKTKLIDYIKEQRKQYKPSSISDFITLMQDLDSAVKSEDFIFGFQNSLAASAFAMLSSDCSDWKWEIQQTFIKWQDDAEEKIKASEELDSLLVKLQQDAAKLAIDEEEKGLKKLEDYYNSDLDNKRLIENYKDYFTRNLTTACEELKHNAIKRCQVFIETYKSKSEFRKAFKEYRETVQKGVNELVKKIKLEQKQLSEEELNEAFEKMWGETVKQFSCPQNKVNICYDMEMALLSDEARRKDIKSYLEKNALIEIGKKEFAVTDKHIKINHHWYLMSKQCLSTDNIKIIATSLITECEKYIDGLVKKDSDYNPSYCAGVIKEIDKQTDELRKNKNKVSDEFLVEIKVHICGIAVHKFEEMHERFNKENDPKAKVQEKKAFYCEKFKDLFHDRNDSQKLAKWFCGSCLKPALMKEVKSQLSKSIATQMRETWAPLVLKSIPNFQLALLVSLKETNSFDAYVQYIKNYDQFAQEWLAKQAEEFWRSGFNSAPVIENTVQKRLREVKGALDEITKNQLGDSAEGHLQKCLQNLMSDITLQSEDVSGVKNVKQFVDDLSEALDMLKNELKCEIDRMDKEKEVKTFLNPPHEQLYSSLKGCGEKCPYCGTPCELEGNNHEHYSRYHRALAVNNVSPRVLPFRRWYDKVYFRFWWFNFDQRTMNCQSAHIHMKSCNTNASGVSQWGELYKDYTSTYWQHVLESFSKKFAKKYFSRPVRVKESVQWEDVEKDLEKCYQVKLQDLKHRGKKT